jgi:hypothetical protein
LEGEGWVITGVGADEFQQRLHAVDEVYVRGLFDEHLDVATGVGVGGSGGAAIFLELLHEAGDGDVELDLVEQLFGVRWELLLSLETGLDLLDGSEQVFQAIVELLEVEVVG